MKKSIPAFFSKDDLARITAAVKKTEGGTSGEIVPFIVGESDPYDGVMWRAGLITAVIPLGLLIYLRSATDIWFPLDYIDMGLVVLSLTAVVMLLARFHKGLKRLFAGSELIDRRVTQRAYEAFLSEEVFNTRDRSGVLIFISLLEHKVVVLGDSGVNAKVREEEWTKIADCVIQGLRSGKAAAGLIRAIGMTGELLEARGFVRRPGDRNELSNEPRRG